MIDVREGLRTLLYANNHEPADDRAIERMNRALRSPGLAVQLDPSQPPDFRSARRDLDSALALVATIVAVAQLDGRWPRLKACPGDHCGWVFYDNSRNQASGWCSMQICGQWAKRAPTGDAKRDDQHRRDHQREAPHDPNQSNTPGRCRHVLCPVSGGVRL